ncbi:hypothetical protein DFH94DRAFT_626299 [Russula ochroleuca]|uniref:Uncharacterized protein n=1 Tax=Russula ochroleuca TaxID=152965 RepID=A0A9P5N1U9_9AGAM|nr:hypothetical protein DFH94DRAFT_626299 [Russula ochroleuca]
MIRQSPGMVIVEVDRYFEPFDSLLGMHSWSQFLKRPTEEDMDKSSKVFWCVYNSGRLVQKNGWKRVDIEEHWFDGWSPSNKSAHACLVIFRAHAHVCPQ